MDERGLNSEECKIFCLPPELLVPIFILAQAESNQYPFPYNVRFDTPFPIMFDSKFASATFPASGEPFL
jgi:hypothetical protein